MKPPETINKKELDELIALIPELESYQGSFGEHDFRKEGNTLHMGPFIYSPLLDSIVYSIREAGLYFPFDWPSWQDEAERICNEPGELEKADLETIRKLLTLHLRKERFCEGHLASICESGLMLSTLLRLKALRDEGAIEAV
jgi:hypothetical protein